MDPRRVGVFGQSAGGITAASAMYEDRRIRAGIDLDGTLEFNQEPNGTNLMPVAEYGLRRTFVLMGRDGIDHTTEPWRAFWSHGDGWKRDLTLLGSRHQTYTDLVAIMPQAGVGRDVVECKIGTVDPSGRGGAAGVRRVLLRSVAARAGRPSAGRTIVVLSGGGVRSISRRG